MNQVNTPVPSIGYDNIESSVVYRVNDVFHAISLPRTEFLSGAKLEYILDTLHKLALHYHK